MKKNDKCSFVKPRYAILNVNGMGYDTFHYALDHTYSEDPYALAQWIVSVMSGFYDKKNSGGFKYEVAVRLLLMLKDVDVKSIEKILNDPESKMKCLEGFKSIRFGKPPKYAP